jgi:hypothetical protein
MFKLMNVFALIGYLLVCIWQPIQIGKLVVSQDVSGLSPLAIGVLALGMILIQAGFVVDKAKPVYLFGNGFAAVCSLILFGLYFVYR